MERGKTLNPAIWELAGCSQRGLLSQPEVNSHLYKRVNNTLMYRQGFWSRWWGSSLGWGCSMCHEGCRDEQRCGLCLQGICITSLQDGFHI